jgi:hypothetical protein
VAPRGGIRCNRDVTMTDQEIQAPICLGYQMRKPLALGMFPLSEPLSDWLHIVPGAPFEVRAWDSGRWTIRVGREQVAAGRAEDGTATSAAAEATDKLREWGAILASPAQVPAQVASANIAYQNANSSRASVKR